MTLFKRGLVIATLTLLPIGSPIGFATSAQAAILWTESTDGDLSDTGAAPTRLAPLLLGSNLLSATFNAGTVSPDPDYFTIEVPEGLILKEIILRDWQASPTFEDVAFMGLQSGDVFDFVVPADRSNAIGLLGWTHLRSTQVGSNKVLTELARSNQSPAESGVDAFYNAEAETYTPEQLAADPDLPDRLRALATQWVPGATGFDQTLGAGQYTFWLRQGSDTNITTLFDFHTAAVKDAVSTPEPLSLLAIGFVSGAGILLKRRRA